MQNVESKQVSFILGKNRLVNTQLEGKSVPSLEFQAVALGTETLVSLKEELSGMQCVKPIEIVELVLHTDSLVSLNWISNAVRLNKMNKVSVFIKNRLGRIQRLCDRFPVKFNFVSGELNPADCITRALSYKQLTKTNYFLGPKFLISRDSISHPDVFEVIVPNLNVTLPSPLPLSVDVACADVDPGLRNVESLVDVDKYSNFQKIVRIHMKVLTFVRNLKSCLKNKDPDRYAHLDCYDRDLFLEANRQVIESNQRRYFPEVYHYFESKQKLQKDIPNIVQQLNVFMDNHGILRVRSKVSKLKNDNFVNFPMLLHKKSRLTQLIIMDMHCKFCHAGVYSLLSEMRKGFWIPHYFSVVKKVLKSCVICRRFKEMTIKLNQSPYRDFRVDPPQIPFRHAFVDHLGPFNVKLEGKNRKVWLLCISCLWSRAVNLKLCMDLTTKEFLRCFQLHCFDYGVPQLVLSDLGSQIVAGANVITDFLNDHEVQNYFKENDAKPIKFEQYFKGCNKLGG